MKDFIHAHYPALFAILVLVVIGLSFALGYGQGRKASSSSGIVFSCANTVLEPQKITPQVLGVQAADSSKKEVSSTEPSSTTEKGGAYMGSKNGTKYYTPGCSGTKRIKPENYIWFQSVEDATLQGYTKGSC